MLITLLPIIATLITASLVYYQIPVQNLQQTIAIILVAVLILLSGFLYTTSSVFVKKALNFVLILLCSMLIQILVVSSGGFYSPFLILVHLFALGCGFLINLPISIIFLVGTLGVLLFQIQFTPSIHQLFIGDPWSVVLYIISFLVIIPLAYLLSNSYRIKDSLSTMLKEYIQFGQKREETILSGLNEMVIVTDINLSILYTNVAVENELGRKSEEIIHRLFLDVVSIKDARGEKITPEALEINMALMDKTSRTVQNLYFYGKRRVKVNVQTRPIVDANNKIIQIVFVLDKSDTAGRTQPHIHLEQSFAKYSAMIDEVRRNMPLSTMAPLRAKIELVDKVKEDLITAQELEDHLIKQTIAFHDIAMLCKQITVSKQNLAQSLQVPLRFNLDQDEVEEWAFLHLAEKQPELASSSSTTFSIPIDAKWLSILIQKLIDLCLLLSLNQPNKHVDMLLYHHDHTSIAIEITAPAPYLSSEKQQNLFIYHFGELGTTTPLLYGSGLEGFIIKTIIEQLTIPLTVKSHASPNSLSFVLTLSSLPR